MRNLIKFYILVTPVTTWLALTGWLRLPIMALLVMLVLGIPYFIRDVLHKPLTFFRDQEDYLLIASLFFIVCSFVVGYGGQRSFNHMLSYGFSFLLYLIFVKYLLRELSFSVLTISKWAGWSAFMCSLIVIIEWVLINFFGITIRTYLIFDETTSNMVFYAQSFFNSVAGVSEEPSLMAFNLNVLFPLGLYALWQTKRSIAVKSVYIGAYVVALFFTASSGGLAFILLAMVTTAVIKSKFIKQFVLTGLIAIFVVAITIQFDFFGFGTVLEDFLLTLKDKTTLSHRSGQMRTYMWFKAFDDFKLEPLLGRGPGFGNDYHEQMGYQSVYFKILAESGLPALLCFVVFILVVGYKVSRLSDPLGSYFCIAFFAGVYHYIIADAFYHPAFWVTIVAIQMQWYNTKANFTVLKPNPKVA